MRIVSLVPSATEIVAGLGLAGSLVGISADCDYPPEVRTVPVLTEAVVADPLSSPAIDRLIRGRIHTGQSVYHLDAAQLAWLRPDVILTQELCAVCAPPFTTVRRAARLVEAETRIVSLEPRGLDDILDNVRLVGKIAGVAERAAALAGGLRRRIEAVAGRWPHVRPRVVCVEWLDPIWIGGHWVPEMVALAGGTDVLGAAREASRVAGWDDVRAADPDVLVVMACGFDLARTRAEIGLLTDRPGWEALPAVRAGRVYLTNASAFFNRPGPRIVDGLEALAGMLHPESGAPPLAAGVAESL